MSICPWMADRSRIVHILYDDWTRCITPQRVGGPLTASSVSEVVASVAGGDTFDEIVARILVVADLTYTSRDVGRVSSKTIRPLRVRTKGEPSASCRAYNSELSRVEFVQSSLIARTHFKFWSSAACPKR